MIILDTNVVSELMKDRPEPQVALWFNSVSGEAIATTAAAVYEIMYGVLRLPAGKRRVGMHDRFRGLVGREMGGMRVLELTEAAAHDAARFRTLRERSGLLGNVADMLIAGIVNQADAVLSTRNTKDFSGLPIKLLNPWDHPATLN